MSIERKASNSKKIFGMSGAILLMGAGMLGVSIYDAASVTQEINKQVDLVMGLLPDDQVHTALGQLNVQNQITDSMGFGWSNWNRDLNTFNTAGLRIRINRIREISDELRVVQKLIRP